MFGPGGPSFGELVYEGLLSTVAGYDHLAPKFDTTPFRTPDKLLDLVAAHLERGPRIGALLDLCCGTGAVLRRLEPLYDRATGVDFSPGMLEVARKGLPEDKVRLIHADIAKWEPEEQYDVVTCFGAFGHILPEDQPAFLKLVHRSLKPGGRFVFVTSPHPSPTRPAFWAAHAFNWTMRIRNALIPPPFVMYYLTFLLPEALDRCRDAGFETTVSPLDFPDLPRLVLVEAARR